MVEQALHSYSRPRSLHHHRRVCTAAAPLWASGFTPRRPSPTPAPAATPNRSPPFAARKCALDCDQRRPRPLHPLRLRGVGGLCRASLSCYALPRFHGVLGRRLLVSTRLLFPRTPFSPACLAAGARYLNRLHGWVKETTTLIYTAMRAMYVN